LGNLACQEPFYLKEREKKKNKKGRRKPYKLKKKKKKQQCREQKGEITGIGRVVNISLIGAVGTLLKVSCMSLNLSGRKSTSCRQSPVCVFGIVNVLV